LAAAIFLEPRDSPFFLGISFSGVGGPANAPRNKACNRWCADSDLVMSDTPNTPYFKSALVDALLGHERWSWNQKYHPGLKDHMHALGVISANFNDLEVSLFFLFYYYLNDPQSKAPGLIFGGLDNKKRINIIKSFAEGYESPGEIRDLVFRFVDGFDICSENRHSLMHSSVTGEINALIPTPDLSLKKHSRSNFGSQTFANVDLKRLRKIADEIYAYDIFGFGIYIYLQARRNGGKIILAGETKSPSLPVIIPLPDKLILLPPPVQSSDQQPLQSLPEADEPSQVTDRSKDT
jgi:hypothetical protein